ncbi:CDP-alcohol phosphatidyltransferase family protein [Sphaerothrix gracilis]|uniref:CDP-alcohol phosphatidyltransferase family protein n=1 Tax=Sphaerothrix gracilis TaxID=3151835 RepID=UPI0031FC4FC5
MKALPENLAPQSVLKTIPNLLIIFRFFAAFVLLKMAWDGHVDGSFTVIFILAVISDIIDGMIARRFGGVTAWLREADSRADLCLYICVALSLWRVYPQIWLAFELPLLALIGSQILHWLASLLKYGRLASYHSYSAKFWGLTLAIATVALFGFGYAGWTLGLAIVTGILHNLEEIVMTLLLPEWSYDVVSLQKAWQLRSQQLTTVKAQVKTPIA